MIFIKQLININKNKKQAVKDWCVVHSNCIAFFYQSAGYLA